MVCVDTNKKQKRAVDDVEEASSYRDTKYFYLRDSYPINSGTFFKGYKR